MHSIYVFSHWYASFLSGIAWNRSWCVCNTSSSFGFICKVKRARCLQILKYYYTYCLQARLRRFKKNTHFFCTDVIFLSPPRRIQHCVSNDISTCFKNGRIVSHLHKLMDLFDYCSNARAKTCAENWLTRLTNMVFWTGGHRQSFLHSWSIQCIVTSRKSWLTSHVDLFWQGPYSHWCFSTCRLINHLSVWISENKPRLWPQLVSLLCGPKDFWVDLGTVWMVDTGTTHAYI